MLKYIAFTMIILLCNFSYAYAQHKITLRSSVNSHFSYGKNRSRIIKSTEPNTTIYLRDHRIEKNPFFSLNVQATCEVVRHLNVGIHTGIQFHLQEPLFYKAVSYIVPVGGVINYDVPISKKMTTGISIKAGFALFKINNFVIKANNASVFSLGSYANISNKIRIVLDWEKQKDFWKYDYTFINPNSKDIFKYKIKMNAFNLGVSYKITE